MASRVPRFSLTECESVDFPGQPYSASVLSVGYCLPQADGTVRADGSITLLSGPRTVLVDTGGPWSRDALLGRLQERGLVPGDVSVVVGTHGHSDHVGNLGLFPGARIIVGYDVSTGDLYEQTGLARGEEYRLDEHVLIPAIHIQLTSARNCCANRCGMFLSIGFAALGVLGAIYSLTVASLGLSNGPTCLWSNTDNPNEKWGAPFANSSGSYLGDKDIWKWCKEPEGVVEFNLGLFSTLLVASCLQLVLCAVQMVNGLFGCLCGTCGSKE